jgi:hypothetical protein
MTVFDRTSFAFREAVWVAADFQHTFDALQG